VERRTIGGLTLLYEREEAEAAAIVEEACLRSLRVIEETWGLAAPADGQIHVMTSWIRFLVVCAPWPWRVFLAVTFPLWAFRTARLWRYAGGWAQRFGGRQAVGIKPPRLMKAADRSIGQLIYIPEEDFTEKVRHVTCHELTHACAAHLKLPSWLNEGLAMLTVDRFFGRPTIRPETLEGLQQTPRRPAHAARLNPSDKKAIARYYARGYWIVRMLTEIDQQAMRGLLRARRSRNEVEDRIAAIVALDRKSLWREMDRLVLSHFSVAAPPT
jgi:hypothetical protein